MSFPLQCSSKEILFYESLYHLDSATVEKNGEEILNLLDPDIIAEYASEHLNMVDVDECYSIVCGNYEPDRDESRD